MPSFAHQPLFLHKFLSVFGLPLSKWYSFQDNLVVSFHWCQDFQSPFQSSQFCIKSIKLFITKKSSSKVMIQKKKLIWGNCAGFELLIIFIIIIPSRLKLYHETTDLCCKWDVKIKNDKYRSLTFYEDFWTMNILKAEFPTSGTFS